MNKQKNQTFITIVALLLTMTLIIAPTTVSAYDSATPYTVTLNYIVPSDTSFTVTLAGAETTIDFNPTTKDSVDVEPDSQIAGSSTPIATITNTGNLAQNFSVNLTTVQASWAVVSVSNFSNYTTPVTLSETAQTPNGWTNVAAAADVKAYMKANFTNATAGTTAKTLQINSVAV